MAEQYKAPQLCVGTLDLSADGCHSADTAFMESIAAEHLEIGGAKVNVFRLLGVHEQGLLVDLTGLGNPLSSGTQLGFILQNAFTDNAETWRSSAQGLDVSAGACFIGYNFGTKKTSVGTERYAIPQPVRQHITTLKIQQGPNTINRVLQARIERSDDGGVIWNRVDIVNLPDTPNLETISIKQSAASQLWRIVPLMFNGGPLDSWEVNKLELMDYQATELANVQDLVFLENRDRDYAKTSMTLRAQYDILDIQTELSKFGIDIPQQYMFTVSFPMMVEKLGRPVVIGDLLELPSEAQYDTMLRPIKKWLEVTDATWATDGFTPGWKPTLFRFTATPALASQENRGVLGSPNRPTSDLDFLSGASVLSELNHLASETIAKESVEAVPETGSDTSELTSGLNLFGTPGTTDQQDYMVEDGMPPNNLPYTEGVTLPANPVDGAYHRLNYDPQFNIPTKLFQWSAYKHKWMYLESDRRAPQSAHKPGMAKILQSASKKDLNK